MCYKPQETEKIQYHYWFITHEIQLVTQIYWYAMKFKSAFHSWFTFTCPRANVSYPKMLSNWQYFGIWELQLGPCMPLTAYNSWKGEGESRRQLINYQAKFHSSEDNQQNYYQWTSEVQRPKPKGVRKKIQQFHNENSNYPSNSLKIHICLSPFHFARN